MLKNWWIWKIEIWSQELIGGYQTVRYQPRALISTCLVVFPTHFNPNNSLQYYFKFHVYFRLKGKFYSWDKLGSPERAK